MKYNTDKRTRKKIDKLLEQNARNVANFGTKSKHDLRTKSEFNKAWTDIQSCLLYTSPSPRDRTRSRMPSSA